MSEDRMTSDDAAGLPPAPAEVRTRRALLAGAGVAGAAVLLAGCGDSGGDSGQPAGNGATGGGAPGDSGTGSTAGSGSEGGTALAKTSEIPVGGGKIFGSQAVVVTQPTAGQFKGFSAICTHQGCPVSRVEGGTIECTCHGSRFSIADGSVQAGPAPRPLDEQNITVTGDSISLA
ncbi:Rieske (2Fe-2S) protein [Plantactinospora sp. KBS50]|uniref:Rieske (2Fe-2S) protein n=1 Tax=Plantactinospora sp. KBS50 TaxID=2024580 RepID=UPI000BAAF861|nr:Rieske (2Fe-2S) protein [Plantactinospora sp. KBS50]ASW55945.1 Rieske (2Fe-2S) protein [Plantactinospora sp. KBS50]